MLILASCLCVCVDFAENCKIIVVSHERVANVSNRNGMEGKRRRGGEGRREGGGWTSSSERLSRLLLDAKNMEQWGGGWGGRGHDRPAFLFSSLP